MNLQPYQIQEGAHVRCQGCGNNVKRAKVNKDGPTLRSFWCPNCEARAHDGGKNLPFSMAYYVFHSDWNAWLYEHGRKFQRVKNSPFRGKNMMADEILGVYRVNDEKTVEFSRVDFLGTRMVGLTIWNHDGLQPCASSFLELEQVLGLAPKPDEAKE